MKKIVIVSAITCFTLLTGCMSTSAQRQEAYALQAEARIADEKAREASKKAGIKYESPEKKQGLLSKLTKKALKATPVGILVD
jgi:hypothetical protein